MSANNRKNNKDRALALRCVGTLGEGGGGGGTERKRGRESERISHTEARSRWHINTRCSHCTPFAFLSSLFSLPLSLSSAPFYRLPRSPPASSQRRHPTIRYSFCGPENTQETQEREITDRERESAINALLLAFIFSSASSSPPSPEIHSKARVFPPRWSDDDRETKVPAPGITENRMGGGGGLRFET